jgi:hypothetical protein
VWQQISINIAGNIQQQTHQTLTNVDKFLPLIQTDFNGKTSSKSSESENDLLKSPSTQLFKIASPPCKSLGLVRMSYVLKEESFYPS